MTHDDVAQLREGNVVRVVLPTVPLTGPRGRVTQVTDNFVRVDWIDTRHSYDVLRRTSPLWRFIEKEA